MFGYDVENVEILGKKYLLEHISAVREKDTRHIRDSIIK